MIINEKYLRDIDDEDDDSLESEKVFSSKRNIDAHKDWQITIELWNERRIQQYGRSGNTSNRRVFSSDAAMEYYDEIDDVLSSAPIIKDYFHRMTFSIMDREFDTSKEDIESGVEQRMQTFIMPVMLIKFDINKCNFKMFSNTCHLLVKCMHDFIDRWEWNPHTEKYNSIRIAVNSNIIEDYRDLLALLEKVYNNMFGAKETAGAPKTYEFRYNKNARHISVDSEKPIDDFKEGDILYATESGELVSQETKTPIAICVYAKDKDHRFMSLNYMSRMTPETGEKRLSPHCYMPFGAKGVIIASTDGMAIGWNGDGVKKKAFYDNPDVDYETCLSYLTTCYSKRARRIFDTSEYFAEHIHFSNKKGMLQAVLCVNRFHTLGTASGDWYLPAQCDLYAASSRMVDGAEMIHILNDMRARIGYKPIGEIAWSASEMDKNAARTVSFGQSHSAWEDKDKACVAFAMLRITD